MIWLEKDQKYLSVANYRIFLIRAIIIKIVINSDIIKKDGLPVSQVWERLYEIMSEIINSIDQFIFQFFRNSLLVTYHQPILTELFLS